MATIPAPTPVLTRFQAQRRLGLFAGIDYTLAVLIAFSWMTLGFWKLFGDPDLLHLLALAALNLLLLQIWIVVLAYRVLIFIMDLGADINLLPEAAARIAASYLEGQPRG